MTKILVRSPSPPSCTCTRRSLTPSTRRQSSAAAGPRWGGGQVPAGPRSLGGEGGMGGATRRAGPDRAPRVAPAPPPEGGGGAGATGDVGGGQAAAPPPPPPPSSGDGKGGSHDGGSPDHSAGTGADRGNGGATAEGATTVDGGDKRRRQEGAKPRWASGGEAQGERAGGYSRPG